MLKSLLMIAIFFCLISGAGANPYNKDDRYFRSDNLAIDTVKAIRKKPNKYKNRHNYTAYAHNKRKAHGQAPITQIPAGARFVADAIEVATVPFRAIGEAVVGHSLHGVVAPLAAKAREIEASCGSKVISAIRHTYIKGTGGRLSLHASGRAVDMKGNPSCIYSKLDGWQGGYSIDYNRVKHVHISYAPNGPEWGIRFNHYNEKKHKKKRWRTMAGVIAFRRI